MLKDQDYSRGTLNKHMAYDIYNDPEDVIEDDQSMTQYGAVTEIVKPSRFRHKRHTPGINTKDNIAQAQIKASIAGLWRDGELSYQEIAETVNDAYGTDLKPNNISYHIKTMVQYWRNLTLARIDERQAMLLARIDQIEQLATNAYFASMTGKTVTNYQRQIEKARSDNNKKKLSKKIRKERKDAKETGPLFEDGDILDNLIVMQEKIREYSRFEDCAAGDPRWLQILLDCNKQRAQIWNVFNAKPPEDADAQYTKLTDEDRHARLESILNTAAQRRSADVGALAPAAPLGGFKGDDAPPADAGPVLEGGFFEYEDDDEDDDWE